MSRSLYSIGAFYRAWKNYDDCLRHRKEREMGVRWHTIGTCSSASGTCYSRDKYTSHKGALS
jgi:hypothetical protein